MNNPDQASPSFKGLKPASEHARRAAQGSSKKSDTRCEVKLRKVLWRSGARYRKNVQSLPGKPDIVFGRARLVVFCDGDFWHGKNWEDRRGKLEQGANASYWIAKIQRNRERDRQSTEKLERQGWSVLRYWESEIHQDIDRVAHEILAVLEELDKH